MKVLFVATVPIHINTFHLPYLKYFKNLGFEVHVATNEYMSFPNCDKEHVVPFERNPFKINNIKAYTQLKSMIDTEKYDIIHCHTPVGGAIARLAAKKSRKKNNTKVVYTAHGFHFYKGAPLVNWIAFYPVEKYLSKFTDALITINKEDYNLAKEKMKAKNIYYVPGVGLDTDKIANCKVNRAEKRKELGISDDDFVVLSVGELNENKNHKVIINAISKLNNSKIHYFIAGCGPLKEEYNTLIETLNLKSNIHLLGYRKDVIELYTMANIFCFPSFREGLSVSLMEAMASGLPCVVSKIRGNVDLIDDCGGCLINPLDDIEFGKAINNILNNGLALKMGEHNIQTVKNFTINIVSEKMKQIYDSMITFMSGEKQ
ncbi:MAG: glycosyltransferase family 4 protein [Oscillospiraceae bacterium]